MFVPSIARARAFSPPAVNCAGVGGVPASTEPPPPLEPPPPSTEPPPPVPDPPSAIPVPASASALPPSAPPAAPASVPPIGPASTPTFPLPCGGELQAIAANSAASTTNRRDRMRVPPASDQRWRPRGSPARAGRPPARQADGRARAARGAKGRIEEQRAPCGARRSTSIFAVAVQEID